MTAAGRGWFAIAVLLAAAACEPPPEEHAFEAAFDQYRADRRFKAMAVAADEAGEWAYGAAYDVQSERSAVENALDECEINRGRYAVQADCRLYAVGDRIVWNDRDPFADYRASEPHKAFAMAVENDGPWVHGTAYGEETAEAARERAMAECDKQRPDFAVEAPCVLVWLDDEQLAEIPAQN